MGKNLQGCCDAQYSGSMRQLSFSMQVSNCVKERVCAHTKNNFVNSLEFPLRRPHIYDKKGRITKSRRVKLLTAEFQNFEATKNHLKIYPV